VYNAFWGNWAGREDEYYRECGRLVNDLKGDAVIALCGSRTRVQLEIARGAWERLSNTELPSQLTCGSYQLLGVQEGGLSAITYSSTDPIGLPSPLLPLLHHFDGRPTTEILEELLQEHGVQLEEDLLKKLVDWGILG
jgi:hypothetical protein